MRLSFRKSIMHTSMDYLRPCSSLLRLKKPVLPCQGALQCPWLPQEALLQLQLQLPLLPAAGSPRTRRLPHWELQAALLGWQPSVSVAIHLSA